METTIDASVLRLALITLRDEQLRLLQQFPETYRESAPRVIAQIDSALLPLAGNVTSARIVPTTCNPWR